ncbi:SRPBCC family protein [Rhodoferax sp. AJA081-3]|uniref:SRPBCC family protein n=1 Tax=Rhodoferax sp. AJA081-3 TaxID=2752316 RepID=UPI001ADF4AF5|nr:SRPBCC family protein [Rhodoferax sp. AJA081-3]QTN27585.1 SRPBCC family protein [Rhodoferax sp. AJA081-3]
MVKKIVVGLLAAIALLLIFAATRPDSFRVERRIALQADPAKVYALLNDFHHFPSWSPWQSLDPSMKVTYSGAASGQGAVYEWSGNDAVGAGRMEILKTVPNTSVTVKLDFLKPFEARNTAEYTVAAAGGTTTVTWAMYGPSPFISKVMGVFVSMDSMIGKDFERGLANLKAVAEKPAAAP